MISPEFTYCNHCNHNSRGLQEKCVRCGSEEVVGETRVVGYFSKIQNWNKSKRYGELVARQKGRYSVEEGVAIVAGNIPAAVPAEAIVPETKPVKA